MKKLAKGKHSSLFKSGASVVKKRKVSTPGSQFKGDACDDGSVVVEV
jgi:hypothetical protein